jgi:putative tryptophan/tyrosine transport system substrate-binding protein
MTRREFITLVGGVATAWPLAARAQQAGKVPRIGALQVGPSEHSARLDPLLQGLHELGYTEGQNIAIERRYGEWKLDRLPELAAELVRLKVDVIAAFSTPAARAAKQRSWRQGRASPAGPRAIRSRR